jgi:hypothetical protein
MPLFVASLVLVGVVHELGHALAACAEKVHVNGFGLFIVLVYPGAFTEIDQVCARDAHTIMFEGYTGRVHASATIAHCRRWYMA